MLTQATDTIAQPQWVQVSPSGTPPAARVLHSAVYDQTSNRMTVFGGGVGHT